jgi:hypothetical protein
MVRFIRTVGPFFYGGQMNRKPYRNALGQFARRPQIPRDALGRFAKKRTKPVKAAVQKRTEKYIVYVSPPKRRKGKTVRDTITIPVAELESKRLKTKRKTKRRKPRKVVVGRTRTGRKRIRIDEPRWEVEETYGYYVGGKVLLIGGFQNRSNPAFEDDSAIHLSFWRTGVFGDEARAFSEWEYLIERNAANVTGGYKILTEDLVRVKQVGEEIVVHRDLTDLEDDVL